VLRHSVSAQKDTVEGTCLTRRDLVRSEPIYDSASLLVFLAAPPCQVTSPLKGATYSQQCPQVSIPATSPRVSRPKDDPYLPKFLQWNWSLTYLPPRCCPFILVEPAPADRPPWRVASGAPTRQPRSTAPRPADDVMASSYPPLCPRSPFVYYLSFDLSLEASFFSSDRKKPASFLIPR